MWLFPFFRNKAVYAVLNVRHSTGGTERKYCRSALGKTRHLTTYPQAVNFMLLNWYVADEVIAKTESEIKRFAQPSNMKPPQNTEELVTKSLSCKDMYEEHALNEIFIECLDDSICHRVRK